MTIILAIIKLADNTIFITFIMLISPFLFIY